MTLESVTSTLEERGIVWQGVGFAAIGAISVPLLSIYSEADHWSIGVYSLAMTQFNWAFALAIGLVIEGVRRMFETRTEIRRAARTKAIENALKKERAEAEQAKKKERAEATTRLRRALENRGVENPDQVVEEVYGADNGRNPR